MITDYRFYSAVCEFRHNPTKSSFATLYRIFRLLVVTVQRCCSLFKRWKKNSLIGHLFACIRGCRGSAFDYFTTKLLNHCRHLYKLENA